MRLYKDEKELLKRIISKMNIEVYLFGSRVDDSLLGGDIDLLVFSNADKYQLSKKIKLEFQKEIDEKIDVIVMDKYDLSKEDIAFLNSIDKVKLF